MKVSVAIEGVLIGSLLFILWVLLFEEPKKPRMPWAVGEAILGIFAASLTGCGLWESFHVL